jgi:nucleotide-binding universal stress UspA family protein
MMDKYSGKMNFEFVEIEGEGEVGPILEKYIESEHPDAHLLVVGTRNKGALER